jgi:outer membrane receptor for ferrienterochelin and colicins
MNGHRSCVGGFALLIFCALAGLGSWGWGAAPSTTQPTTVQPAAPTGSSNGNDLTGLSLEQLMQIPVATTNTLTHTDRNLVPAALTTIDRPEIDQANARSLTELLDIYVPNFESSPSQYEQSQIGERGINGDRDNKFLVLVNGQEINERSHGFLPEMDLELLGDLKEVDMVRGPGSSTYGPGAVAGVISMQTYNGLDYDGAEFDAKGGFLDEFYSGEFKYGRQLGPDSGFFIYGGSAQLTGANDTYAPTIEGGSWTSKYGPVTPGSPVPFQIAREDAEYDGQPQVKIHGEYDNGGLSIWARYTRGGEMDYPTGDRYWYAPSPIGFNDGPPPGAFEVGYDQLTESIGYKTELTRGLQLDASSSFEVTDFERAVFGYLNDYNQEQKLDNKATLNWQMTPANQLAAGVEYREYWMGLPSWMGLADNLAPGSATANGTDSAYAHPHRWESNMESLLLEDQWHINDQWTALGSGRVDKDRYTEWLLSPRAALSFTPTAADTYKLIADQSLRTNDEEDMRAQWENSRTYSHPETLTDYEFRYEHQQSKDLFLATSVYYNRLQAIDWGGTAETPLGSYKTIGIEGEATYRTQDDAFTLSHGFTKLVGQNLSTNEFTNVTAARYGYGYDLADWSNNVTKLTAHHQFDQHLSVDGNVQVLWGFAGDRDVLEYNNSTSSPAESYGSASSSAFDSSVYVNLGAQYAFDSHSSIRVDAYNVAGWFDQTLNKYQSYKGVYRVAAPAFGLSYTYSF